MNGQPVGFRLRSRFLKAVAVSSDGQKVGADHSKEGTEFAAVKEGPPHNTAKELSNSQYVEKVMQPYHTEAVINPEGKIVLSLPFPVGKKVDVVVLPADEDEDDNAWKDLAAREFLSGYSEEDGAYDNYKL